MDHIVLSYHDSLLRESDVTLLDTPNWLNDRLIGFYFEYLERQFDCSRISFITPDVTQFIKLYQGPELGPFLDSLLLHEKNLIVLAVNNNSSTVTSGGSHWSTLIFNKRLGSFHHYDSLSPSNQASARQCANNITSFLLDKDLKKKFPFVEETCPCQHNSYDCGVYAMLFAKMISENTLKGINQTSLCDVDISGESVFKWRQDTKCLIYKLAMDSSKT